MDYREFRRSKMRVVSGNGFQVQGDLNSHLHDWQAVIVRWALNRGRAGLFADTGLGKSLMQLVWAESIVRETSGKVLILAPACVRQQTKRESEKFGIGVRVSVVDDQIDCCESGIFITNYEKLHRFDCESFAGVVLDESSILKSYTGKTKRQLIESFRKTPYKLSCTATPAPNDYLELGNQADFLGVMPSNEMISRWFINDTMKAGGYRLKNHAIESFWRWVASWAVVISRPSDIGFSDTGYDLPKLIVKHHIVDSEEFVPDGFMFPMNSINATTMHQAKRRSVADRAAFVANLVKSEPGSWLVWCDTDYESYELKKRIPGGLEVTGSMTLKEKEFKLMQFVDGEHVLITKPTIAGFGLNFQHCHNQAFIGLSYSYEAFYQAVRRCWRYGQTHDVMAHIVSTPEEEVIGRAVFDKQLKHERMKNQVRDVVRKCTLETITGDLNRETYTAAESLRIPNWIGSYDELSTSGTRR